MPSECTAVILKLIPIFNDLGILNLKIPDYTVFNGDNSMGDDADEVMKSNIVKSFLSNLVNELISNKKGMTRNTKHQYNLSSEPRIHTNIILPIRYFYFCASFCESMICCCDMLLSVKCCDVKI